MKEWGTNQSVFVVRILIAIAIGIGLLVASPKLRGQNVSNHFQASTSRPRNQDTNPPNQTSVHPTGRTIFTGVISRSGDKFVLTDPLTRTSYQLDDQRKAQEMVNKNVKVAGVLDPSTGTIRVTAIEPY